MPDNLTRTQRSYCMSQVKGKDTALEKLVRSRLHREGLRFRKHVRSLPGKPDIVFVQKRLAVFIDGDFWHGYRFPSWRKKLNPFWREKIGKTILRDKRNFLKLRRMQWRVHRVWQHSVDKDIDEVVETILRLVRSKPRGRV